MKGKILRRVLPVAVVLLLAAILWLPALTASAAEYDVTVAAKNNLAANKYDWLTDQVGTAKTTFGPSGMRLENFNTGGSCFAEYQSNKFGEFKYSMYAKLHLTNPSAKGYTHDQYTHDYANLYISFMIAADEPRATSTCPWSDHKAYFSLCFENLQGSPKTLLYRNESYAGHGEQRLAVAEDIANTNWNDDEYHWFEFTFVNDTEIEYDRKGNPVEYEGKRFTFMFDGVQTLTYFQRDKAVPCASQGGALRDVPFTTTTGYLGYWTNSDFPVGANTTDTDCYVDIQKVQITSYDNDNQTPYEICPKPDFDIEVTPFVPEASYDAGEEIEVRLSDIFYYEGDDAVTYSITCDGQALGTVRNGYWVWTPEEAGAYDIDFRATAGDKSKVTYATVRVVAAQNPNDTNTDTEGGETPEDSGCGSRAASSCALGGMAALLGAAVLLRRRKRA